MKRIALYCMIAMVALLSASCTGRGEWQARASRVEASYTYLKTHGSLPDSIDLEADATWLSKHGHARYAGEAYYILGAYENLLGDDSTAMRHLKLAEQSWQQAKDAPAALVGMTLYKQGRISENEMLTDVALYHYRRALPYLEEAGDSLYLSAVYREIGRMTQDTAEQRLCFEQAWAYAESLSEALKQDTRYAILATSKQPLSLPGDSIGDDRLAISKRLADQAGMERYAADVVRNALRQGRLEEAAHYLQILKRDTVMPVWSKRQYALLHARYLYMTGDTEQAYTALENLYEERLGTLEREGAARSFTIAERFDNAAERERNLRLEMHNRGMWFGVCVALLLILMIAAIVRLRVLKLRSQVTEKQDQLKSILLQRITQGQKLTNIFADEQDWQAFRQSFDSIYDGRLQKLEQKYPSLTTADLHVIALSELGLDNSEICQLLNQSKRTIWNRRQRIKKHMNQEINDPTI